MDGSRALVVAEALLPTSDADSVVPNAEVVPSWNATEVERLSIVPVSVVPFNEAEATGFVTGAASRATLREQVLLFELSSESTRTSTVVFAPAAGKSGRLGDPEVTLV